MRVKIIRQTVAILLVAILLMPVMLPLEANAASHSGLFGYSMLTDMQKEGYNLLADAVKNLEHPCHIPNTIDLELGDYTEPAGKPMVFDRGMKAGTFGFV